MLGNGREFNGHELAADLLGTMAEDVEESAPMSHLSRRIACASRTEWPFGIAIGSKCELEGLERSAEPQR